MLLPVIVLLLHSYTFLKIILKIIIADKFKTNHVNEAEG